MHLKILLNKKKFSVILRCNQPLQLYWVRVAVHFNKTSHIWFGLIKSWLPIPALEGNSKGGKRRTNRVRKQINERRNAARSIRCAATQMIVDGLCALLHSGVETFGLNSAVRRAWVGDGPKGA